MKTKTKQEIELKKKQKSKLPNFVLAGAAKSGTTSLYFYMKQHPEIFVPPTIKEPNFCIKEIYNKLNPKDPRAKSLKVKSIFTFSKYQELFKGSESAKAIGDCSVAYLHFYKIAIKNIKKYLGDPKIIILLRNPIDRAFSAYTHLRRDVDENISFEEYLELEKEKKGKNWSILNYMVEGGSYYNQVKAYIENFSNVKILFFDDLKKDRMGLMSDLFKFLQVDEKFKPNLKLRHNISGVPKSRIVNIILREENFLKKMIRPIFGIVPKEKFIPTKYKLTAMNLDRPKMKKETRKKLVKVFEKDIKKLEKLTKRDLSSWLTI